MSKYPISFGRHLLLERINVGGMAEVFKAKSFGVEGFERIVAVKRILPTLVEDDEFTTMFVDEARIAAQLTHQNIVQIYDLGRHDETFYISMEYVAGRDLRAILDWQKKQGRPMEVAKACFVVSKVCEALEYAHKKRDPAGRDLKIIHRDVTPQNVILSYEGEVKLCDFGIAKAASRMSRTQVGVLKGKFAYMSPEQVRGQPIDRRSDLFALGVIFYEMLTGERLFLGESDYATLEAVRNAVIPPPRALNPAIGPDLEAVMLRMLAKSPRDRYQWASEVHEDLLEHLVAEGRPYHARHLRQWIQKIYARDIEIENAKLERFMALKMPALEAAPELGGARAPTPVPEEVVLAMGGQGVAKDPAETSPAEPAEPDPEAGTADLPGDPTDHFPVPNPDLTYDDATDHTPERAPPRAATNSPVSDMWGAPELEGEAGPAETSSERAVVRPASSSSAPQVLERPESDGERTQFDMQVDPALVGIELDEPEQDDDGNETLYDDGNETVMGDDALEHEISAAQAELLSRLGQAHALGRDGSTIDGTVPMAREDSIPELDPDDLEEGHTLLGDDTVNGSLAFEATGEEHVAPLVAPDDTDEDAFAATALRSEAVDDDDFDDGEGGTVEDAPLPRLDPRLFAGGATPVEPAPEHDTPASSSGSMAGGATGSVTGSVTGSATGIANSGANGSAAPGQPVRPAWRRPPSVVAQGRATPRPIIERNHTQRPPEPAPLAPVTPKIVEDGPRGLSNPRVVMMLAGGMGLLAAVLLAVVLTSMRPKLASLKITCEPRQVQVLLDGALVGDEAPLELEDLEVGPHRVELSAPGYVSYRQTIDIKAPKPHQMSVVLERAVEGRPSPKVAPPSEEELPMGDGVPEE